MSSKKCYTPVYTKSGSESMDYEKIRTYLKNKTQMLTMRINPELLKILDEALRKDKQYTNRNELIESLILKYLEEKGKI
jgi:metal-responsive CopG/Arc/MetJ family transcriptional regulator